MGYASALALTLERDDIVDPIPALKCTEKVITARLRHPSETWVRVSLSSIYSLGLACVIVISYLLTAPHRSYLNWVVALIVCCFCTICGLAFPLARVVETFAYDVLRALHNPLV